MAAEIKKLEETTKSNRSSSAFELFIEWKNFQRQNPNIRSYRYAAYVFLAEYQDIVNKPYTVSFKSTNDLIVLLSNIRVQDTTETA